MDYRFFGFFSGFPDRRFPRDVAARLGEELTCRDSLVCSRNTASLLIGTVSSIIAWRLPALSDWRGKPPDIVPALQKWNI